MKDVVPHYLSPVSIIPGGCPQFLDFSLPEEDIRRLRMYFREEKKQEGQGEGHNGDSGRYTHYLRCLTETENGLVDQLTNLPCEEDYAVEARRAVEILEGQWLPIPFLRTLEQLWPDGEKRFECGPSNWARARIARSESFPGLLRTVVAFDTNVEDRPAQGEQYHALSPQDVTAHGVNLNVLDEGQLGLALDLQLNERVLGAANDEEEVVAGNVQVTGLGAVAVEDRGDLASAAGAAGSTLTKLGTLFGKQDGVVAHVFSFVSQVRRRCRQSEGNAWHFNSGPVDNGRYGSALAGATPIGYLTTRADVKREPLS